MQAVFTDIDIQRPKQQRASVAFIEYSRLSLARWFKTDVFRLIVVAALPSLSANGSSFVVAKSQQQLVVAADSAMTLTSADGTVKAKGPDICKIISVSPRLWIVFAGDYRDPTTNIDFTHLALAAARSKGSVKERADGFERNAIWAAEHIYAQNGRHTRIAVAFVGIGATEPFFYVRSISHTLEGIHKDDPVDCAAGCNSWTAGGHTRQITRLAEDYFEKAGLVKGAEDLIQAEIDADTTGQVGGPIAIFEINSQTFRFTKNGTCNQY
jgi:hypothetical protein